MKKNLYWLAGFMGLMLTSCDANDAESLSKQNQQPGPVDVYVAGMKYADSPSEKSKAVYWKNNVPTFLSDGTRHAKAEKILVVGSDVYVFGTENNEQNRKRYKLWKNGTSIPFISNELATVYDFWVEGNDVYAVGKNEVSEIVYWKNAVQTILGNNDAYNSAQKIKVVNGDVYIAGFNISAGQLVYWKNGVTHPLTPLENHHGQVILESIDVVGDDVYVAGNYMAYSNGNTPGDTQYGVYWKNGNLNVLGLQTYVSGICIKDNDVYISGSDTYGACYFKNGQRFSLTNGTLASEIKVLNGNIYASGYLSNPKTGLLWINGVQSSYENADAKDLFIVQN